jgi:hypothetical protein
MVGGLGLGVAGAVAGDAVEHVDRAAPAVEGRGGCGGRRGPPERPRPAVGGRVDVVRGDARGRSARVRAVDRDDEARAALAPGQRGDPTDRRGGVHQPGSGQDVGAGVAVPVADLGGVDGQGVEALRPGERREAVDPIGRPGDRADRHAAEAGRLPSEAGSFLEAPRDLVEWSSPASDRRHRCLLRVASGPMPAGFASMRPHLVRCRTIVTLGP